MPDLSLTEHEQDAVRSLMALDPVPGEPLPSAEALEAVSRLIPSDEIGASLADVTGCLIQVASLARRSLDALDPQVCEGPLTLGIVHQSRDPRHRDELIRAGIADGMIIGFRSGRDHVAQMDFERSRRMFSERDLALLRMITPALQRLMRERHTARLPASLTVAERRVVQLLAIGMSNSDIAARLHVAPSTVRKHLEHAFPKLGVTNRLAAARAFEDGLRQDPEHVETIA